MKRCLYCRKLITHIISRRQFCLECGIKFYKELRWLRQIDLNILKLNSLLYFKN